MTDLASTLFDDPFGLFEPDIFCDPYPVYHILRHADPVHWCAPIESWLLTRYDDCLFVLTDRSFASGRRRAYATNQLSEEIRRRMTSIDEFISHWLMNLDAPEHVERRAPINKLFTKACVDRLEQHIVESAEIFIDRMLKQGESDFIADFAQPLPVAVIARMVGVPQSDLDKLFGWFARMSTYFELGVSRTDTLEDMDATILEFGEYLDGLLEMRRLAPQDDLLTHFLALEDPRDAAPRARTRATLALVLFAGHESTRATFGNGLLALLGHPGSMARLRDDPALIDGAINEMLRFDGPFMRLDRIAVKDVELRGRCIVSGDRVVLILGAANRDPTRFPTPDTFDIDRADLDHLAFGYGEHFCVGARLARLELSIGFKILLRRLPTPRLVEPGVAWRRHFNHRGPYSMPLAFGSHAAR